MSTKRPRGEQKRTSAIALIAALLTAPLPMLPVTAVAQQAPAASPAAREPAAANGQQRITLNLKDADIGALISTVSEVTGKNFIVDPRVKAKVTVISQEPMPAEELYRVFLSVLQVHGFSAVQSGPVVKIVPDINAKQLAVPTVTSRSSVDDDLVVTRVIPVQNVPVAQLVPILRPLVPQQGHLAAYPPTNVLIVSDRASNIARLADIIQRVDQAGDDEIEVIPLQYASAPEIVRIVGSLQQIADPNQPPGSTARLAADERTNSVLLSGDKGSRLRLRALIAHLDTPVEAGGDVQVIYLRYAKATELVPVLTGVSENLQQVEGAAQGQQPAQPAQRASAARGQQDISIEAHEATNALVITAPPKIQRSLQAVIRQLDIRRAQVLVEAAIAEVSDNLGRELGVEMVGLNSDGPAFVSAFDNGTGRARGLISIGSDGEASLNPTGIASGLSLGIADLNSRFRFGVLIRALASNSAANILSTPSLVTLDNQEAEIRVARNVPFVTGQYTSDSGNVGNPFQTVTREDVGLILKVKPQINEGDDILLDIEQEVSDVADRSQLGIETNKRSIKTSVLVADGQLVVLGGLIDDAVRETEQKIPGLGDIPLLGNLFTSRTASKEKRNLMLFLQPSIIRDEALANAHTSRKYSYMRNEQLKRRASGITLMPRAGTPVLPRMQRPLLPPPFASETEKP